MLPFGKARTGGDQILSINFSNAAFCWSYSSKHRFVPFLWNFLLYERLRWCRRWIVNKDYKIIRVILVAFVFRRFCVAEQRNIIFVYFRTPGFDHLSWIFHFLLKVALIISVTMAISKSFNISWTCLMWWHSLFEKMVTSSRQTRNIFQLNFIIIIFSARWKQAAAFVKPNGILTHWEVQALHIIAVFDHNFFLIFIFQYP